MTGQSPSEIAACPVCGNTGRPRYHQRDLYCGVEGEFGQNYCAPCHLFYLSPRVPESCIDAYYPRSYEPYRIIRVPALIHRVAGRFSAARRRRRVVERFIPAGRILGVGCGNGAFLQSLDRRAWECHGMDLEWTGGTPCPGEFHPGRFDRDMPPLENLDAITMWHVFEHLYHPRRALEYARAILRPGGFLIVAIPEVNCLERAIFGKYWIGWDPPRHLATYSSRAISGLLSEAGFHVRDVLPDSTGDLISLNCDFVLRGLGIQSSLHGSLILRALFSPFAFGAAALGLAPAKIYVAQR